MRPLAVYFTIAGSTTLNHARKAVYTALIPPTTVTTEERGRIQSRFVPTHPRRAIRFPQFVLCSAIDTLHGLSQIRFNL